MPIFRAAWPCRASRTTAGTSALTIATISATGATRPSMTPSSSASLTSPMPIPAGYASAAMKRKPDAASPASSHSGEGWSSVCAASTTAAAGRTIRFGMILRSRSVTETATSVAQKNEATAASQVSPKARTHAATRSPVTSSTSGYFHGIVVPQERQRPRSMAHETSGMLSYQASVVPQLMHADAGFTTERRSGTRAATTLRKLPSASPGTRAMAASPGFTSAPPAVAEDDVVFEREALPRVRGVTSTSSEMPTCRAAATAAERGDCSVSTPPVSLTRST